MLLLIEARDKNLPSLTSVDDNLINQDFLDALEKTEVLVRVQLPDYIRNASAINIPNKFERYNPATKQWETI